MEIGYSHGCKGLAEEQWPQRAAEEMQLEMRRVGRHRGRVPGEVGGSPPLGVFRRGLH